MSAGNRSQPMPAISPKGSGHSRSPTLAAVTIWPRIGDGASMHQAVRSYACRLLGICVAEANETLLNANSLTRP